MSIIRSGVGLVSGINSAAIVDALISLQRAPIVRLENRVSNFQSTELALKSLEATLVSITTSVQALRKDSTFNSFNVANSDSSQISVSTDEDAVPGLYQFQALREASRYTALSNGFANADQQTVGTGTLTIATGGQLHRSTLLDAFNAGNGTFRGVIRITDRSGASADIDLSNAYTVDDVLDEINSNSDIAVEASTSGGRLVLTDTTGSTSSDLTVVDLFDGQAAVDLGISKSVAADTLNGEIVYEVTDAYTLDQLNDGNALRRFSGAPDVRFTLKDESTIEVNLDDAVTLADVVDLINDHEDNNGTLAAAIVDGRLELDDLSGGSSWNTFAVEDINSSSVVRQLGLDVTAVGTNISGRQLTAGINSVLLANLRGGQGIDQIGQISLTDRAGVSATIDLTGAESLDEVIGAINAAESGGGTKLQLTARVNDVGTGITIEDSSGSTVSNLIIADVGGSTLAAQLGIEIDDAVVAVDSGSLNLRYINEASSIENYAPDGNGIEAGSIRIVDSAGNEAVIEISTAVKNIGDVLQRINAAEGILVTATLNDRGDGFVLIDEAGGSGTLQVEEVGGDTASDLRLLGDAVTGSDGKDRIESRFAAVIDVSATDTLDDIVEKINNAAGFVTASVFDDGSAFNSSRLSLVSAASGTAGRLVIDSGGLNLGLSTVSEGEDALLRSGSSIASGFIVASETNSFENISSGIDVSILSVSDEAADVTISRDTAKTESVLQQFVDSFNTFVKAVDQLTRFDAEANVRGVLQGSGVVLRVQSRVDSMITRQLFTASDPFQSLVDFGIRSGEDGELEFNEDRLAAALASDPAGVADFFLAAESGFADSAEQIIESMTDPFTGTFSLEETALQTSIGSLTARITQLDEILEIRRERLFLEFVAMENILSSLRSQQQALSGVRLLSINPIGTGIF